MARSELLMVTGVKTFEIIVLNSSPLMHTGFV